MPLADVHAKAWLKVNMKGGPSAKDKCLAQIMGVICMGLRLMNHHARTVGGGADLNGIKLDYISAAVWGGIAYIDHINEGLFTEKGQMNKKVCGAFAVAFAAAGAGMLPDF